MHVDAKGLCVTYRWPTGWLTGWLTDWLVAVQPLVMDNAEQRRDVSALRGYPAATLHPRALLQQTLRFPTLSGKGGD
jgi:hypothetical protein